MPQKRKKKKKIFFFPFLKPGVFGLIARENQRFPYNEMQVESLECYTSLESLLETPFPGIILKPITQGVCINGFALNQKYFKSLLLRLGWKHIAF